MMQRHHQLQDLVYIASPWKIGVQSPALKNRMTSPQSQQNATFAWSVRTAKKKGRAWFSTFTSTTSWHIRKNWTIGETKTGRVFARGRNNWMPTSAVRRRRQTKNGRSATQHWRWRVTTQRKTTHDRIKGSRSERSGSRVQSSVPVVAVLSSHQEIVPATLYSTLKSIAHQLF